ncbi:TetR/AcrR family transcriptional regulator [Nocardioides pantholopis]|uniref:TetR/AcrR family transcriptional regulator n=1 Tax=Nocardioides pantholopis TaxID=2483798 RepID=UPI000F094E75|nr:TetR/AcrR family transcriptional regulator [Nocardioides pantholopis]
MHRCTRDLKRQQTAVRITRCAQVLTAEQGLDGFTMDELADAAGVSRRTLFNYYPGKLDAVLGPVPLISEAARREFVAGGPTGDLIEDLAVLARTFLEANELGLDREGLRRVTALVTSSPKLLAAVHERFEEVTAGFVGLIGEREGNRIDQARARLLIRLVVTVFEAALTQFLDGDDRPMPDLFDQTLHDARSLLA